MHAWNKHESKSKPKKAFITKLIFAYTRQVLLNEPRLFSDGLAQVIGHSDSLNAGAFLRVYLF